MELVFQQTRNTVSIPFDLMAVFSDGSRPNHVLIGEVQPDRVIPSYLAITGILLDLPGTLLAVIKTQYRASVPQELWDTPVS